MMKHAKAALINTLSNYKVVGFFLTACLGSLAEVIQSLGL